MATNFSNVTSVTDLMNIPNNNTGGMFWTVILYMIWIVMTLIFISYGLQTAILTSTFVGLVLGIFLVYMGLISWGKVLWMFGLMLFTIIYLSWKNNRDVM
jgi:hypothetical protein